MSDRRIKRQGEENSALLHQINAATYTKAEVDDLIEAGGHPDHNDLDGLNAGDVYEHISQDQKDLLHAIYTLEVHNNTKHDPNYSEEGHNHNLNDLTEKLHASLTDYNAETNVKHLTDAQVAALHTRLHTITDILDHSANNHKIFFSDDSGHIIELALGDDGEVLTSTGTATAPAFEAVGGGEGSAKGTLQCDIIHGGGTVLSNGFYGLTSTDFWVVATWRVTANMDATKDMKMVMTCRERSNVTRPSGTYSMGVTKTDNTEEFQKTNLINAVAWEANSDKKLYTWTEVIANADFGQGDLLYFFIITDSNYDFDIFDISVEFTEAG